MILAPHNGGATWDVRGEVPASVARNIVAWIRGERAPGLLDHEACTHAAAHRGERWAKRRI